MRARRRSESLEGMKTLLAITAAAALATATPAHGEGGAPPLKDGTKCHMTVKRTLGLGKVLRRGLPVKVTCDGPAKLLVMPEFDAMSKASIEYDETYGAHRPPVARAKNATLTKAGTVTLKPRFTKVGAKILRHHAKTKVLVALGTLREDGHYWSDPGDWAHTTLKK
jgi:hypothetical protein